jgi:hypothetical protein
MDRNGAVEAAIGEFNKSYHGKFCGLEKEEVGREEGGGAQKGEGELLARCLCFYTNY